MALLAGLRSYGHSLRGLKDYFAHPLSVEQSRAMIRERVTRREELFLDMARTYFYASVSPYRALLDLARCTYRDLELMVRQQGIEPALRALRASGVYLSFEEFHGGEARREGHLVRFSPSDLQASPPVGALAARSGGTRSAGRWFNLGLVHLAQQSAPQYAISLDMLAGPDPPVLIWLLGFPSGAGGATWFSLARIRRPPARWFSLTPFPRGLIGCQRHHNLFVRTAHLLARRAGIPLPLPEFTPTSRVAKVLTALRAMVQDHGRCLVLTTPSCAVRLAAEAERRGESLRGAIFLMGGEPLTPAKAGEIRRAGGAAHNYYALAEVGSVAAAPCGRPVSADDMHFRSDILALITAPRSLNGDTVPTLMFTSLHPTGPRLLLNVELDDFALVEERKCGCPWDELGCRVHLREVRSFTKLTGEGTTLIGSNCVHVIEHVLPAAFGGMSTDYQLVEAEDERGLTRLFLLVSPRVGPVDEPAVVHRFAEALRSPQRGARSSLPQIWAQADSIKVVRRDPVPTALGKLLPFQTLGASIRGAEARRPQVPGGG